MTKTFTLHVHGMHCNSCVLVTERELRKHPKISRVQSSLKTHSVEIQGDFGDESLGAIAEELTDVVSGYGYSLAIERQMRKKKWEDFKVAIPLAIGFIAVFVLLQKIGIVNLVSASRVTYGTAFAVGIIASLSTCMAVVGGLVLSMSATFAKEGDAVRPQLLFHGGRLLSFFILGGVLGALGKALTLAPITMFAINILIGAVMLILGINLLDVFHGAKRFQFTTPKFISRHAFGVSELNHTLTPFLVGIATFFLPCGFTQSMQLYTLTTGGFVSGGLTMLAFAVGTLPVLALISFSSFSIHTKSQAGIFFKTAGLVVIAFAIFNLINSAAAIGLIPPIFTI